MQKLILLLDQHTNETIEKCPRFIREDQVAIARFKLTESDQVICMEPFKRFPQLARFMLRDRSRVIILGKVLKLVE